MLEGCTRTCKKSCRRGAAAGMEFQSFGDFCGVCADSQMDPCRHMLATQDTVENDSGIRCKVSFLFDSQDCASARTIFHQLSRTCFLQELLLTDFSIFSRISFFDFAVESCSLGMHSGGTTGRRKEKTGRGGGGAGIRVWASNWQPVTTADWPQVRDCLNS